MREHRFDVVTDYCTLCGASRVQMLDGVVPLACLGGGNVVAISHLVARRALLAKGGLGGYLQLLEQPSVFRQQLYGRRAELITIDDVDGPA